MGAKDKKFYSYQCISSQIVAIMKSLRTLQSVKFKNCLKSKWVFMLINGKKEICLFGTICKLCIVVQEAFQAEDCYLEHKEDLKNDIVYKNDLNF